MYVFHTVMHVQEPRQCSPHHVVDEASEEALAAEVGVVSLQVGSLRARHLTRRAVWDRSVSKLVFSLRTNANIATPEQDCYCVYFAVRIQRYLTRRCVCLLPSPSAMPLLGKKGEEALFLLPSRPATRLRCCDAHHRYRI